MIMTTSGPIQPRMPRDGIGGHEPRGQRGLVAAGCALLVGRWRLGLRRSRSTASDASAVGAVPVTAPSYAG